MKIKRVRYVSYLYIQRIIFRKHFPLIQSGAVTTQFSYGTQAEGEENDFVYGRALNCSQDTHREVVECLRGIPADDITDYLATVITF